MLRALVVALVGIPPFMQVIQSSTDYEFRLPLQYNGFTPQQPGAAWDVSGVTAPTKTWWGNDPTGSGSLSTEAWTATGTPTTGRQAPFCRDGSHLDLDTGDCMDYTRHSGTNQYYTSDDASIWSPATAAFTVVVLFRTTADSGVIAANREGAAGEGWSLSAIAGGVRFALEDHDANEATVDWDTVDTGDGCWWLCSFAYDTSSTEIEPNCNGSADTVASTAAVTGTIAPTSSASIGADSAGGTDFAGDVGMVLFFDYLQDTTDKAELWQDFNGLRDTKYNPVTFASAPGVFAWFDGSLQCFGDDMTWLGNVGPTGHAAAADGQGYNPAGFGNRGMKNYIPYSRDLSTGWTSSGTLNITATSTDLFDDGRQTQRITDDDGAAVEYIYVTVDMSEMNTGNTRPVWVYAKDSSGTKLDLQIYEKTGGSCTPSTIDFAAKTIGTGWALYDWDWAAADGDCTEAEIRLSPGDFGTAADTGSAEFVVMAILHSMTTGTGLATPFYTETAGSVVEAGAGALSIDITGTSLVDGSGNLDTGQVEWSFIPDSASQANAGSTVTFYQASANDNVLNIQSTTGEEYQAVTRTAAGSYDTICTTTTVNLEGVGDTFTIQVDYDYTADSYEIFSGGASKCSSAVAYTAPTSIDNVGIGGNRAGDNNPHGWLWDVRAQIP